VFVIVAVSVAVGGTVFVGVFVTVGVAASWPQVITTSSPGEMNERISGSQKATRGAGPPVPDPVIRTPPGKGSSCTCSVMPGA
jgi:hypothetical protein